MGLVREELRLRRVGPEACWGRRGRGVLLPAFLEGKQAGQSAAGIWCLWEAGGEEAEGLALVGRERRPVAIEVSRDAAAGGA